MSDSAHPALATFRLYRERDVTGISGEGVIAEGVQFSDGWVVTHWLDQPPMWEPKTDVWHHKGTGPVTKIHGHDGATRIVWADEQSECGHFILRWGDRTLGPCVREPGHTEVFHRDANGTEWRPTRTAPAHTVRLDNSEATFTPRTNDTQACPYCTGGPPFPRQQLGAHVESTHARVLAALARGVSLDELLHDPEAHCQLPHEMEG